MDISKVYNSGGDYLKAEDLGGKMVSLTIDSIDVKDFARDDDDKKQPKLVLSFVGKEKQFVLNKTNATTIAEALGTPDTDNWTGKEIKIFPTKVQYGDKMVDAIRVKLPEPEMAEAEDEVPF